MFGQYMKRISKYMVTSEWLPIAIGFVAFLLLGIVLRHVGGQGALPPVDRSLWVWI